MSGELALLIRANVPAAKVGHIASLAELNRFAIIILLYVFNCFVKNFWVSLKSTNSGIT